VRLPETLVSLRILAPPSAHPAPLLAHGLRVIRFKNDEVEAGIDSVLPRIAAALQPGKT